MTAGKNKKKLVRDIQKRTEWSYTFCLRIVTALGYETVSREVDDHFFKPSRLRRSPSLEALGVELNRRAKE